MEQQKPHYARGFTCGTFDLPHAGHVLMFKECKQICDYLIVGLQTDPSISRPSKNSPIQSLEERKIQLDANKYVDEVIVYETEDDLHNILQKLIKEKRIDVRILGADWKGKQFTGYELPIPVCFNSRDHKYSTSNLRQRVFSAEAQKRGIIIDDHSSAG